MEMLREDYKTEWIQGYNSYYRGATIDQVSEFLNKFLKFLKDINGARYSEFADNLKIEPGKDGYNLYFYMNPVYAKKHGITKWIAVTNYLRDLLIKFCLIAGADVDSWNDLEIDPDKWLPEGTNKKVADFFKDTLLSDPTTTNTTYIRRLINRLKSTDFIYGSFKKPIAAHEIKSKFANDTSSVSKKSDDDGAEAYSESGFIITIVRKAGMLKAVSNDGVHGELNCQFPKNLRELGKKYKVNHLTYTTRASANGKSKPFYMVTRPYEITEIEESLNKENNMEEELKKVVFNDEQDVDNFFTNKKVIFKGFDYAEIFSPRFDDTDEYDFSDEDKAEIENYRKHEGMECTVVGGSILDTWAPTDTNEEAFKYCYWDIEFEDGTFFGGVPGHALELSKELQEALGKTEFTKIVPEEDELVPLDTEDLLMGHIYLDCGEEELCPTFVDINTLVNAFGLSQADIIKIAEDNKCKLWNVHYGSKYKIIVAAKEIKEDDIREAYIDMVPFGQTLTVEKVK